MITPLHERAYATVSGDKAVEAGKILMAMLIAREEDIDQDIRDQFPYRLLDARCKAANFSLTPQALTLTMFLAEGVPGRLVLYAHAFSHFAKTHGKEEIEPSDIAVMFPNGFPNDIAMDEAWYAQKVGGSNGLDDMDNIEVWPTAPK
jgi:hypothetical protein